MKNLNASICARLQLDAFLKTTLRFAVLPSIFDFLKEEKKRNLCLASDVHLRFGLTSICPFDGKVEFFLPA